MNAVENQDTTEEDSDDIFAAQDDTDAAEKEVSLFRDDGLNESVIIFDAKGFCKV